ncbi:TVP38/TMEM64 family protein [Nocardia sp. 348MFTsu5.1]|uniref:TVP38/TMEM64 family protein n=1 Tax=Nocardia sp. 348MFTsu5.1 TaxID=1172185 RepID=UPI00036BC6A5|nr:TVP38/TMEM64 family protein [Nocardia sp. 348MFTsu5.1]
MISRGRTQQSVVVRAVVVAAVLIALAIAAYLIPFPSVERLREWADSFGFAFTALFFLGYGVITIFPAPRSAFSVSAGLLFGSATGFLGSMLATTFAAVVAFVLVRRYGRERIKPYLRSPVARSIELRMERRGWLAVGSLRLIVPFPFTATNYIAALSSIRFVPYLVATVVGVMPATAAVVIVGDALSGNGSAGMIALCAGLFSLGIIGLLIDARLGTPDAAA